MPRPKSNNTCLVLRGDTFYAKWREPDGTQRMRSLQTKNEREARRALRDVGLVLSEGKQVFIVVQDKPEAVNPTIAEFWAWYSDWAAKNRRRRTIESHEGWWKQFTKFAGMERLGDVSSNLIQHFIDHKLGQGVKKSTINNGLIKLQAIYSTAIRYGRFGGENPFTSTEKFRIPKNPQNNYLDCQEVERLVTAAAQYARTGKKYRKAIDGRNIHVAMGLMAFAGMRKAEVCYARWEWIDFEKKTITVQSGPEFQVKDNDYRVIPISLKLMKILVKYGKDHGYLLESYKPADGKSPIAATSGRPSTNVVLMPIF